MPKYVLYKSITLRHCFERYCSTNTNIVGIFSTRKCIIDRSVRYCMHTYHLGRDCEWHALHYMQGYPFDMKVPGCFACTLAPDDAFCIVAHTIIYHMCSASCCAGIDDAILSRRATAWAFVDRTSSDKYPQPLGDILCHLPLRCANSRKDFLLSSKPYHHHLTSPTNDGSDACTRHGVYIMRTKVCSGVRATFKVWSRTHSAKSFRTFLIRAVSGRRPIMLFDKLRKSKRETVPFALYKYRGTGSLRLRLKLKLKLEALRFKFKFEILGLHHQRKKTLRH